MAKRISVTDIAARKGAEKIVALTAYTAPIARLLDAHVDVLLVGDSLGMTVYGMSTTLGVTLEMMIAHGRTVMQASQRACVVVDLPFASYQESPAQAFASAARVLAETGCHAVKLEGGAEMAETVAFLAARGVPVMGHVGLKPQHVLAMGGYKIQGKTESGAKQILADAQAITGAGAFALVVEGVREAVARELVGQVAVPVIGIGASVACDGQVLVIDDLLGLSARTPSLARQYADLAAVIERAAESFAQDVRAGNFPGDDNTY
jgi:3-methyl-2-oxobutanoate hydroxymethyltransferase